MAGDVFGDRLELAEHFAAILATRGVDHGLIGPREVPRLWNRHILNCAVVESEIAADARVADVGSGAGLPGLALAVARPDLDVVLIEPLLRRTTWLNGAVDELGLTNVTVLRGKAEAFWTELQVPYVTARAVARLDRLAAWCLPLLAPGGQLLALKGSSAADELREDETAWRSMGAVSGDIVECGVGVIDPPTTVLRLELGEVSAVRSKTKASTSRGQGGARRRSSAKRR